MKRKTLLACYFFAIIGVLTAISIFNTAAVSASSGYDNYGVVTTDADSDGFYDIRSVDNLRSIANALANLSVFRKLPEPSDN